MLTLLKNRYSPSRQSTPTPNLNPWATVSTRSTQFSVEAQQPRATSTKSAPPIPAPPPPANYTSRFEQNRERQRQLEISITDRDGRIYHRDERAPVAFIREEQTLVPSKSDSTTDIPSPTKVNDIPGHQNVSKRDTEYNFASPRDGKNPPTTITDGSDPGKSRDNSEANPFDYITKQDPRGCQSYDGSDSDNSEANPFGYITKQDLRGCQSYACYIFFFPLV